MRSRAMRTTLTLLAVGALAAAAYFLWNVDARAASAAANARTVEAQVAAVQRATFELRAAQQAYVAAGQSEQFWFARVTGSLAALRDGLATLRASATTAAAQAAIEHSSQTLQEIERIDRRARDYTSGGQRLLASDVIFSDGLEATGQLVASLDGVRSAEVDAFDATREQGRREQAMYAGGAATIALIALLLLTPAPGAGAEALPETTGATPSARATAAATSTAAAAAPAQEPSSEALPNLHNVAALCSELAKLTDTTSVPALLGRAAAALDASGLVLWIADPDGNELAPVASHGYDARVLSRMGSMRTDAENVTAAAYRTRLLQIIKSDEVSDGAIAAPLVNAAGCMGVMSAEVRQGGEQQSARLAAATIVAAQIATLVAPATRTHQKSEAV